MGVSRRWIGSTAIAIWLLAAAQCAATPLESNDDKTTTPIKHVIIIVGENRSFDHIFGAYVSKSGQSIFNILSQGIIKPDGSPGPNFARARQYQARVTQTYDPSPTDKKPY
jgi:phospholipase C